MDGGTLRRPALSLGTLVVAASELVSSSVSEETTAIIILRDGLCYGLDEVGGRIWSLIQEPRTVQAVRDLLLAEYDVAPEVCERDVIALLEALLCGGLVKVVDPDRG